MKNSLGFGKFEILTVIVLLLGIFAFLLYGLLGGASHRKIEAMKDNAISFSKIVTANISSFHNTETVYLQEAIDERLMSSMKSPVSGGNCSVNESFVHLKSGLPYVTLRCGKFLIEDANFSGNQENDVYEISNWSLKKISGDGVEKKTLYNCKESNKEVFSEYYEELYFVYEINKKYNTDYYFADDISSNCKVVSQTFYRRKKKVY